MIILRSVEYGWEPDSRSVILTLLSDDETLGYKDDVALALVSPSMVSRGDEDKMHLMGPCNGLFCVTDTVDVVLFNPVTMQCRNMALPDVSPKNDNIYYMDYENSVGFGFNSVSDDYKVIRFESIGMIRDCDTGDDDVEENEEYDDLHEDLEFKVGVFSLKTNCWGETTSVVQTGRISTISNCNLFLNGGFHWLGGDGDCISWILVFDLNKEAWKQFELPDGYLEDEYDLFKLSVLNESLATIVYPDNYYLTLDVIEFTIWVMMEYGLARSWKKLYNINDVMGIERPLSFGNKEEFLLENIDGQLVSFNMNTREVKEFQVHRVPGSMQVFRYNESLVPLNQ